MFAVGLARALFGSLLTAKIFIHQIINLHILIHPYTHELPLEGDMYRTELGKLTFNAFITTCATRLLFRFQQNITIHLETTRINMSKTPALFHKNRTFSSKSYIQVFLFNLHDLLPAVACGNGALFLGI